MDIHEYQGKEILASYGVKVQRGYVANNPQEAVAAAKKLTAETGTGWHVIKAQVHAGGRGKGGGVKLAKNLQQVEEIAEQIIGMQLTSLAKLLCWPIFLLLKKSKSLITKNCCFQETILFIV